MKLIEIIENPQLAQEAIGRWLTLLAGLVVAVIVGYWVGTSQQILLVYCAGLAVTAVVVFGFRQRAWVLILVGWSVAGYTAVLPVPLSVRDMAILMAACAFVGYRVLARKSMHQRLHWLEWILVFNFIYLGISYAINPVGFLIFGSETVGARPYVTMALAAVGWWVLVRLPDSPKLVARAPLFLLAGVGFVSGLYLIGYFFPQAPNRLTLLYAVLDIDAYFQKDQSLFAIPRVPRIGDFGMMLAAVMCSYYEPGTLFNVIRARCYGLVTALVCILASGFRSFLLWAMAAMVVGSWMHRKWRNFLVVCVAGALLFSLLVAGQGRFYELPMAAQRALAFLPGQWSPIVLADVEGSTVGRVQWWKDIVKYGLIKNWWFGDGFGARLTDIQAASNTGTFTDFVLLTGAYHNGPLTAIRYIGIVGMVLFYVLMIGTAIYAYRGVQRSRGTAFQPLAIFLAIQAIWTPFHYTFVFGAYDSQMPQQILLVALLRLQMRMLDEQRAELDVTDSAVVPAEIAAAPAR